MKDQFLSMFSYRVGVVACFLLLLIAIRVGSAGVLPMPPENKPPTVKAESKSDFVPRYSPSLDEPSAAPNHPPIDQIPPMPMPDPTGDVPGVSGGASGVIVHDAETGQIKYFPDADLPAAGSPSKVPGFGGVDGRLGDEVWPATFSTMSKITNTQDHPWRMNVKLVMRYGSSYYVCSGTMRDAEVVLTAAHCVHDTNQFADEIWVYPGWDGNGSLTNPAIINPYGYGKMTNAAIPSPYLNGPDYNYDVGLIALGRSVGTLTGWFGAAAGDCTTWALPKIWHNSSYPAESCGQTGLHNGQDMYYRYGQFDACYDTQQLQLNTTPGCFSAVWGGQSGSGVYFIENGNRFVHGITSRSDRSTIGLFSTQYQGWIDYSNNTFIPVFARGSSFDLQPLRVETGAAPVVAGTSLGNFAHLANNPTNADPGNDSYYFDLYLSVNSNISQYDTHLGQYSYTYDFSPMSSVIVGGGGGVIPADTPPGFYYVGVIYDDATDGVPGNNDTDDWDAARIEVIRIHTFDDVPPLHWAFDEVEQLVSQGVTSGCSGSPPLYCPDAQVTRAQMAIFLLRSKHGASYTPPPATGMLFSDVPASHWAAAWIEQLANEGVTSGCGNGKYCPGAPVTRDQMAVFILRTEHGSGYTPPSATGIFDDVPVSYWAASWIEQLYSEGITGGCSASPLRYCPTDPVSRAQMAVFLVRAFFPIPPAPGASGSVYPEGQHPVLMESAEGVPSDL